MKKVLVCLAALALATAAFAQPSPELNETHGHSMAVQGWARPGGGGASNLSYHGGPVIHSAKVVCIFWGTFPSGYTTAIQNFRNQFGLTPEFNTITQYSDGGGNIQPTNLASGTPDYFDPSTPPTNVTDAIVQSEVLKYLNLGNAFDNSTIYEVFIPSGSYSSSGTSTSCGGPNLSYCAYHGNFSNGGRDIKYSIQPWAGCSGCSSFGNTTLDQDHFVCHETREAVTDPDLNAWYDRRGNEADDKCAWTPSPFIGTGGFGYQYEWSNAASGCVATTP